ncbi:MAG: FTR1 family protein [Eubacteriales bacterium]|nr:FTR1 family protein [Eubacteriales bacterium]
MAQKIKFKEHCISRLLALCLALAFIALMPISIVQAKKSYSSWQELAEDMHICFEEALQFIDEGEMRAAYDKMNEAYFGHYEVQGFEANVMNYIASKRVNHIEALFREIKHALLGNYEHHETEIKERIILLDGKVYRDAMVLDGVADKDSEDEVGQIVFADNEESLNIFLAALGLSEDAEEQAADGESALEAAAAAKAAAQSQQVDPAVKNRRSFVTSFVLMLREGMEAILVCVAIITYLVKTGNGHLRKAVYYGMLAGLGGSIILAFLVHHFLGGVGQELIEGWTMFLAVIVLFWVSNWMLSKSEEEAWEAYIEGQVRRSIDRRSMIGLVGAAFLAVIREGAELILFYRASFGSSMTSSKAAIYGLLAAVAVLVAVFLILRYTTVRLPLKPFFFITSILLYVLCISFMGKGVKELAEAGVISGVTTIPAMKGFQIDALGIYDRAETIIPQIMLLIASLWILISHAAKSRAEKKKLNKTVVESSTDK